MKILSLALLLGLLSAPAAQAADPQLTRSDALKDPALAQRIEDFWGTHKAERSFKGQAGLHIFALQFRQPDLAAERGAIIIVSGRTEAAVKYKETIHDLWHKGYSVYIHDHRGQGQSDREALTAAEPQKGHVNRFDDYVADLRQFIQGKVLPAGHRRHYLLAHSMGGAITARYLQGGTAELKKINAAVLSSPMLQIEGLIPGLAADIASCKLAKTMAKFKWRTDYSAGGDGYKPKAFDDNQYTHDEPRYERLLEQYAATPKVQLGSPTWGWVNNACDAAKLAREQAARVSAPVLVMVAGEDRIVHNAGADEFCTNQRRCGSVDGGKPLVIPGSGHEMFIETDAIRDQALQAATAFFARF